MSVKSLLEASFSKQKHHRSVQDYKVLCKRRVRRASNVACVKARLDLDQDFPDLCRWGAKMRNSEARSASRYELVYRFFISRVGKPVDEVMRELHAKLGYSKMAHRFWQDLQDSFQDTHLLWFEEKGYVKYHNVRIELDAGTLIRADLLDPESVLDEIDEPTRGEIERWCHYRKIEKDGFTCFWVTYPHYQGPWTPKKERRRDQEPTKVPFSAKDRDFWERLSEERQCDLLQNGYCY